MENKHKIIVLISNDTFKTKPKHRQQINHGFNVAKLPPNYVHCIIIYIQAFFYFYQNRVSFTYFILPFMQIAPPNLWFATINQLTASG